MGSAASPNAPAQQRIAVQAQRATPTIDGNLADPAWHASPWTTPFVQREPAFGAHGTHPARARVSYDDDALYVAVECATGSPVEARLGRRDQIPAGEAVRLLIDARGDGAGAMLFSTNPSGMQSDAMMSPDGTTDAGWDAVWEVQTTVEERGWRAEFRIPWSVLRFDARAPALRIQIERDDFGAGELTALVPIPQQSPRAVASYAPLQGVGALRPARVFELRPYLLGRWRMLRDPDRLDPTSTLSGAVGTDLKLGITNDLMLDATLNPDFGQVEVDPAVLNLSPYETFFPEKRPFFLEGSDIFQTPLRILHTRRIGQSAGAPDPIHPGGELTQVDPTATIWGASKVTGRVAGVSIGLLEGITAPAYAREAWVDASGAPRTERHTLLPVTNWTAARLRAPIAKGSTVGGMATHVGRFDRPDDAVGSLDWDMRLGTGLHRLLGQVAASKAWNASDGDHTGTAALVQLSRTEHPVWVWDLRVRAMSRKFDPNGLGYLDRPDLLHFVYDCYFRTPGPIGVLRSAWINPWASRQSNLDGLVVDQHLGLDLGATTRRLWSTGMGGRIFTRRYDDRETRGGPAWQVGPQWEGWSWWNTDSRLALRGGMSGSASAQDGGHRANSSVWMSWTITPRFNVSLTSALRLVYDQPRWAGTETDASGRDHYVFGRQQARIVDNTLRAGLALSRRATFDLFSQFLVGSVQFRGYRELLSPEVLAPYVPNEDKSYQRISLTFNAVARYEYRPGSFATLVWLQRQSLAPGLAEPGYGSTWSLLRGARPDSVLMAKLTYLLM